MKTEKQVRTYGVTVMKNGDVLGLTVLAESIKPNGTTVKFMRHKDHLAIVAELEKERDEWKVKAEGWFCIGCQKYLKDVNSGSVNKTEELAEDE